VRQIKVCQACGAAQIASSHRCADRTRTPLIEVRSCTVARWFWREPFNPDSPDQIVTVMQAKGHPLGKSKTSDESTNRQALEAAQAKTRDPFYHDLLAYRAITKVRSTYALKTLSLLDAESRLHPHFKFRPSTQRLCVAAGTPIEVLRDVHLHPRGIAIEAVRPGDWAYTYDENLRLSLRRVVAVLPTGHREVVRVHWRGSRNRVERGYVDVTPEHPVRLVDGTYRDAHLLRQGDRVLSLARGDDGQGYELLYATGAKAVREHRFAFVQTTGSTPPHVHHRDGRKKHNLPANLEGKAVGEHFRHHNEGAGNARWNPASPHHQRTKRNNHEIVAVEWLPTRVDVYDLEIEGTHNFIAGEVCVHNSCASPNVQNCVSRDVDPTENLAAGFRRCVVPASERPGWLSDEDEAAWAQRYA
jgi:hypothetical protein